MGGINLKEFPEKRVQRKLLRESGPQKYRFDELMLPTVQGSIKLEGENFRNDLAYHKNGNKTNNEKFYYKYT